MAKFLKQLNLQICYGCAESVKKFSFLENKPTLNFENDKLRFCSLVFEKPNRQFSDSF